MNIIPPREEFRVEQKVGIHLPKNFNGIYLIGDFPYDSKSTLPFSNSHYGSIAGLCRQANFRVEDCIQLNVLPHYPVNGYITFEQQDFINATIQSLHGLFSLYKPMGLILLGRNTLRHFKRGCSGVDDERGAPFLYNNVTTISTYHPRELYVEYDKFIVAQADFRKLFRLARDGWSEEPLNITYKPSFPECVAFLQKLLQYKPYISTDWESDHSSLGPYSVATCIGFGINRKRAFTIPFVKEGNKRYFSLEEEMVIWRLVARVLESCPQIGHNSVHYDHWFAAYWCGILMHVVDDTMFAHWEVYTELDKSLAFCASLYLDAPYWKDDLKLARSGKVPRDREFMYNGRDNCITLAVGEEIGKEMKELPVGVKQHYRFNIRCSRIFQYMALRGCVINRDLLSSRIKELDQECEDMQVQLNVEAGRKVMVTSPKQMKEWLYKDLRLPVRTKAVKQDDGSMEERETADFLALAYSAREYPDIKALMTAAVLRKLYKRRSSLKAIITGPNGECWWNFGLVSTDSGRAAGYKPNNGMGVQPQNVDRRDRDLFTAGYGKVWGKCDLEGADAWTIACQLAVLGDDTMLKDLLAGLKPAQILSLATIVGEEVITMSQAELLPLLKIHKPFLKTPAGKQIYETDKSVSHGTNYLMQAQTMHLTIFKKSKAEIFVPVKECERRRLLYLKRYPGLNKLYVHIPTILNSHGFIDCPSGMRRTFFGRNDNHRTRVALSLLPQNNTAYATNRFLHNLYYSKYNRRVNPAVRLVVEPINQVHDEADLAFYENELPLVREIFNKASDFKSEVWGREFTIPFDPNYGPTWGSCDTPILGDSD